MVSLPLAVDTHFHPHHLLFCVIARLETDNIQRFVHQPSALCDVLLSILVGWGFSSQNWNMNEPHHWAVNMYQGKSTLDPAMGWGVRRVYPLPSLLGCMLQGLNYVVNIVLFRLSPCNNCFLQEHRNALSNMVYYKMEQQQRTVINAKDILIACGNSPHCRITFLNMWPLVST